MPVFRPHTISGRVLTSKKSAKAGLQGEVMVGGEKGRIPIKEYVETIETPNMARAVSKGAGLGGNIQQKLESLKIKPLEPTKKKKKPISFDI